MVSGNGSYPQPSFEDNYSEHRWITECTDKSLITGQLAPIDDNIDSARRSITCTSSFSYHPMASIHSWRQYCGEGAKLYKGWRDLEGDYKLAVMSSGRDGARNIFCRYHKLTRSMSFLTLKQMWATSYLLWTKKNLQDFCRIWLKSKKTFTGRNNHFPFCLLKKSDGKRVRRRVQHLYRLKNSN